MNKQLTKNFNIKEFACKDGTPVPEKYFENVQELANNLQVIRDYFNSSLLINSAYRTPIHNKKVGGVSTSTHLSAKAADIKVKGKTSKQVYDAVLELIKKGKIKNGGVGLYDTFVHFDIRNSPARWNYSKL